ncbi:hypothetical protein [Kordiimonas pumila]|uniref:DUF2909 domain-containing protein n=1 Tax=Kordiimonas pumila TaxID=2161677 RepID=A0ABV7D9V6_9PROT|nr:hypothetical protein [Kordiimonas pumila]
MILVIFRVLLLLLPLALMVMWLRYRALKTTDEGISDADVTKARRFLLLIIVAIIITGIGLKLSDDSGNTDMVYVPARMENGELIPGKFVPAEEIEKPDAASKTETGAEN